MPQVTSVEPQKKKKERFNVFIDGKFAFGINAENMLKYGVKPGENLPPQTITLILQKEELSKLFDASLNFLTFRPRSQKETEVYLARKISKKESIKYAEARESELIPQVISRLKNYKYINDLEFTKWWIKSRTRSRPKGKIVIKSELIRKGIDKGIIDELLEKVGSQKDLAQQAILKKLPRWQKLTENDFKKKIYSYLLARGFDFDTIREVVAYFKKKR